MVSVLITWSFGLVVLGFLGVPEPFMEMGAGGQKETSSKISLPLQIFKQLLFSLLLDRERSGCPNSRAFIL